MKRILAVGAFERDNFGDLLFLRVLRDFMSDKNIELIPASIIFSDMREVNQEIVYPYRLMLDLYEWDAVWVVGGEVGGVDITSAVLMDAIDAQGQHYNALNRYEKELYNEFLNIPQGDNLSAYLPNLMSYPKNRNTTMVVNSVGISNSGLGTEMSKNEIATLSNSTVSVREEKSAEFCKDNNIPHNLSPDVVSTISHFHPFEKKKSQAPYVVIQINRELLSQTKLGKFASDLKYISEHLGAKIVLLRAGVTFGHDGSDLYEKIIAKFRSLKPKYKIEQYDKRDPLSIAKLIANSKLCIGTSLHCRIVSESYGVPRISLSNRKVANYVSTWKDDKYPYDVDVSSLKQTIIDIQDSIDYPIKSDKLGSRALQNLKQLYEQIDNGQGAKAEHFNQGEAFVEYAREQKGNIDTIFANFLHEREAFVGQVQELTEHSQGLEGQVIQWNNAVHDILNSRSYKLGHMATAPYRILKRLTSRVTSKSGAA